MMASAHPHRGNTVLVAGGSGFLGSSLCEALIADGKKVICVDNFQTSSHHNIEKLARRRDFTFVRHDICEPLPIEEPIHQIYNLACPASPPAYQADPVHTMMTSVVGTGNLLRLAERHGATFLQASTSEVYGDPLEHPQREDYWGHVNCTGPRACYDEGKRAAETLCFDALRAGNVDARVVRIFNTYGPRMQPDDGRIVSNLIVQALRHQPLTIYGNGEQTRSFCYVDDLVDGLMRLMNVTPNPGCPVNIGNPGEFTIMELADLVRSLVPTSSIIVHKPLPTDDPKRRCPDISRAREILDWQPTTPLAEGLLPTIRWFQECVEQGQLSRRARPSFAQATGAAALTEPRA
ncbi:UDP-glucuronic acid decarboxylase family protein [Consotaella salsifontis]|uniref:UDP-glucuronate decarboxylase n=1 Tax=Consotaella salsifontis TaxID=1365950 RepID=A0A1T4PS71_9HYPH|nr:UDP-glucuronic acid decarboxylase family protein [Consotaella salsifontis]SJZ93748.1 UDP-glucuronate decarboxylase [Consotaella salsifontis]